MEQQTRILLKWCVVLLHQIDHKLKYLTTNTDAPQGEQEHRRVKRFYGRTNKNDFEKQIARHERRQARLRALNQIPHFIERDFIPEDLLDKDDLPFTDPITKKAQKFEGLKRPYNLYKPFKL